MKQKSILKRISIFAGILFGLMCSSQTAIGQAQAVAYKVIKLYDSGDNLIYSDELKNTPKVVLLAVEENQNFNFRVIKAKRNGSSLLTPTTNGTNGTNGRIINSPDLQNGYYLLTPVLLVKNEPPKPTAFVNNVETVHNVYQNGRKGMRIYVNFTVKNHKGKAVKASAFFYQQSGTALKDLNGKYEVGDKVAISKMVYPGAESFRKQIVLFLPYDELHIDQSGTHRLQYSVTIYSTETNSFISAPMTTIPFKYTYTIDVLRNQYGGLAFN